MKIKKIKIEMWGLMLVFMFLGCKSESSSAPGHAAPSSHGDMQNASEADVDYSKYRVPRHMLADLEKDGIVVDDVLVQEYLKEYDKLHQKTKMWFVEVIDEVNSTKADEEKKIYAPEVLHEKTTSFLALWDIVDLKPYLEVAAEQSESNYGLRSEGGQFKANSTNSDPKIKWIKYVRESSGFPKSLTTQEPEFSSPLDHLVWELQRRGGKENSMLAAVEQPEPKAFEFPTSMDFIGDLSCDTYSECSLEPKITEPEGDIDLYQSDPEKYMDAYTPGSHHCIVREQGTGNTYVTPDGVTCGAVELNPDEELKDADFFCGLFVDHTTSG